MKFRVLTSEEKADLKKRKLIRWHKWFAWKPIRLSSDIHEMRIFEFVYRKGVSRYDGDGGYYYEWIYADSSLDILRITADNE